MVPREYGVVMSSRISITVPDDVAEHVRALGEAYLAGYVSDAVRRAAGRERPLQALRRLYDRHGQPSDRQLSAAAEFAARVEAFQRTHDGGRPAA